MAIINIEYNRFSAWTLRKITKDQGFLLNSNSVTVLTGHASLLVP